MVIKVRLEVKYVEVSGHMYVSRGVDVRGEINAVRCLNPKSMRFKVWPGTQGRVGMSLT